MKMVAFVERAFNIV